MDESMALSVQAERLPPELVEKVVIGGDLSGLSAQQRSEYYAAVCRSLGLNPLTKPMEYLTLNGKLRLYVTRDGADQLRRLHGISIYIVNREYFQDVYVVTARAKDRLGREDESTGAVTTGNLKGEALANALMKAETKAKRRVTLSIAGLGWLDEIELETIPGARRVDERELNEATPMVSTAHLDKDQVDGLIELARAAGVDMIAFGHDMRRLMQLPEGAKISKKFLRESMTIAQYDAAYEHYGALLKQQVEQDIDDPPVEAADPPPANVPQDPPAESHGEPERSAGRVAATSPLAMPAQIAELKQLAKHVGDDALADVEEMLSHHPDGLHLEAYHRAKGWLEERLAKYGQAQKTLV